MFSLPSATRHFAFKIRHSAGPHHASYSNASKANEPTFLAGDTRLSLFVNPCQYSTYVDSPLRKRPSRKKRFCETNLALGRIGKLGKPRPAHPRSPDLLFPWSLFFNPQSSIPNLQSTDPQSALGYPLGPLASRFQSQIRNRQSEIGWFRSRRGQGGERSLQSGCYV